MIEAHRLIETVTAPLAGNEEERTAANAILEDAFVAGHPAEAETTARLGNAGRRKRAVLWHVSLWVLAIAVLAGALGQFRPAIQFARYWSSISLFDWQRPSLPAGLSDRELLLLGDPSLDELEQKRLLHLSDPDNPAYYAEYAQASVSWNDELPPDYLETVERIAPENAYFLYFAAARIGGESIERKRSTGVPQKPRLVDGVRLSPLLRETEYEITDRPAYEEALEWIARAAELPGFETHTNEMLAARIRLPPCRNLTEFALSLAHAYGHPTGLIAIRKVVDVMCARAEELSKSGETGEFLKLAEQRDAFLAGLARNADVHLVGELVYQVIAAGMAVNFHAAAERLGLEELAETYRKQKDALQDIRDRRDIRSRNEDDSFFDGRASSFTDLALRMVQKQVASPPPITDEELKPMRMVEHEFIGGMGIVTVAILMLFSALAVFLFGFLMPRRIRIPAKRMAGALGAADWCWVLMVGVALPIALFLVVNRMTPLGGRDHAITHFMLAFPGVHLTALWLALLIAPVIVIRWRLSLRLASFGFTNRKAILSIAVLGLVLLMTLAAWPLLVRFGLNPWTIGILAVPVVLAICRLVAHAWNCFFSKPAVRLFKTSTASAVLPAYAVAIIALCLTLPVFVVAEQRWMARETLLRIDPDAADLGAYEFKVAAQLRSRINEIMGF